MPIEEQLKEVREGVNELIAQGKVYRDPEGRIWPKGHPNFKDPVKH